MQTGRLINPKKNSFFKVTLRYVDSCKDRKKDVIKIGWCLSILVTVNIPGTLSRLVKIGTELELNNGKINLYYMW
jgi:hypothetical protein